MKPLHRAETSILIFALVTIILCRMDEPNEGPAPANLSANFHPLLRLPIDFTIPGDATAAYQQEHDAP